MGDYLPVAMGIGTISNFELDLDFDPMSETST